MITELQKLLIVAALVNGAMYLTAVFVAGLVTQNSLAWKLAIVAMGFAFLGYVAQYHQFTAWYFKSAMGTLTAGSVVVAVLACGALLLK